MDPVQQPSNNESPLTKDGILDILSAEDLKEDNVEIPEKVEEKEDKEDEEEIKLEDKEEDEEKLEPDEEDLELVVAPGRKEILAAYPDLFKKFPYLEKSMYRERKYTELLPTIEDAQEAVDARENLQKFETELLSGKTDTILKTVRDTDQNAFGKIVDDYLPALARTDRQAYIHVLGNVARNFITSMVREAQNTKNEELQNAALLLNQFAFGTSEFVQGNNFAKEDKTDPEKEKFNQEKQEFAQERLNTVVGDLQNRFDNSIKSTIANHIDPRSAMPEYVKKYAIKEAQDDLNELMAQDKRYQILKDKLWERAVKSNFSRATVDAIRSAHFNRAKALLPAVIKKSRTAALQGLGKKATANDKEDESPLPVGKTASPRRSSNNGQSSRNDRNDNASKGKKTLDYFLED